jgi:hypothetical protein
MVVRHRERQTQMRKINGPWCAFALPPRLCCMGVWPQVLVGSTLSTERENLAGDPWEKAQAAPTATPKVPMHRRGAHCLVVASKRV